MTTRTTPYWRLAKLPLAVSLASTLAAPAFGVTFNIGEIEGQFDSSLSVGASWSTEKADKDLIGVNNGGRGLSQTSDDGHLNFKRGETFSKIFKGIHDLELKYGDTGVFVRGKYWYDFELKAESRLFKDVSDSNRKEGAQSSGAEILDAFIRLARLNQVSSARHQGHCQRRLRHAFHADNAVEVCNCAGALSECFVRDSPVQQTH